MIFSLLLGLSLVWVRLATPLSAGMDLVKQPVMVPFHWGVALGPVPEGVRVPEFIDLEGNRRRLDDMPSIRCPVEARKRVPMGRTPHWTVADFIAMCASHSGAVGHARCFLVDSASGVP